jgi:protein-S-isoprenylcysteine O-methyltransferase Ste14
MTPLRATFLVWFFWMVSWFVAAFWARRTAARASISVSSLFRLLAVVGFWMLLVSGRKDMTPEAWTVFGDVTVPGRLWVLGDPAGWAMFAVSFAAFAFCWWARIHLGSFWSGVTMVKEGHRVVDTGPYAIVRHPIYTGIIAAAFAIAVMEGTSLGLLGAALVALGFWIASLGEERFLGQQLGEEAYADYRRRVPALIPFGPR